MNPHLKQTLAPDVIGQPTILMKLRDEEHRMAWFEVLSDTQVWHFWDHDYFKGQL